MLSIMFHSLKMNCPKPFKTGIHKTNSPVLKETVPIASHHNLLGFFINMYDDLLWNINYVHC